jgi:hypothetical protein
MIYGCGAIQRAILQMLRDDDYQLSEILFTVRYDHYSKSTNKSTSRQAIKSSLKRLQQRNLIHKKQGSYFLTKKQKS